MTRFKKKKIGVLLGGPSGEREVSLRSGKAVLNALKERAYQAEPIDPRPDLVAQLREAGIEVVYNALHGAFGEDGVSQALLELAEIPYTGCGVTASALTMDKILTKRVLQSAQLLTPDFFELHEDDAACRSLAKGDVSVLGFSLPVVVKPAADGSSLGISICKRSEDFPAALKAAFARGPKILVEAFVAGREITVGLVGRLKQSAQVFPVVEIVPKREFYDYQAKYTAGQSEYFCPADLPKVVAQSAQEEALKAFALLDCRGGVRVDFRLDENGKSWVIELNSSPGMTELSLLPMGAKAAGMSFADLVEAILDSAGLERRMTWK